MNLITVLMEWAASKNGGFSVTESFQTDCAIT